jgi:hypothetical protein
MTGYSQEEVVSIQSTNTEVKESVEASLVLFRTLVK